MKTLAALVTIVLMNVLTVSANMRDVWVTDTSSDGYFPVKAGGVQSSICYDSDEDPAVTRAVKDLGKDIYRVTGSTPRLIGDGNLSRYPIIVGTVGKSRLLDHLDDKCDLGLDSVKGKWECFRVKVVDNPAPGVDRALVIAGSDRRGTIYGIYEFSRQLGVSPWHWWLDAPVRTLREAYVRPIDFCSGEPKVKYRGVFINDEFPSMTSWARKRFGGMNSEMYVHIYELLLRLKANTLWPAMWGSFKEYKPLIPIYKDEDGLFEGNCFNEDDPDNPRLANEYGIIIGTSHHEPMQRSQQEWIRHRQDYGNGEWNYLTNRKGIEKFFREGIANSVGYDNLVTIGMRGDEDRPMTDAGSAEANFRTMQNIIKRQREIIEDVTGRPAAETPQVWTLYSEVLDYYDDGMSIPDDVIIVFCDDNYGDVRRLPPVGRPHHPGGYGMYYHVSYYGAPRACKWLHTSQLQHMWEQLKLTADYGVDKFWILNMGGLKPHEIAIDFFTELAWEGPDKYTAGSMMDYTRDFCASVLGEDVSAEAARLIDGYNKCAARISPEMLSDTTYCIPSGEYRSVVDELMALEAKAYRLKERISPAGADCYTQLVLFPIQALANLYELNYSVAMNRKLYAERDARCNDWADLAERCYQRDSMLCKHFNEELAGGKWHHMMDQVHIGYERWHAPQFNVMPQVYRLDPRQEAEGGYVFDHNGGVVSIEAEHYYDKRCAGGLEWTVIPGYGYTLSGLTLYPCTSVPSKDAVLEYRMELPATLDDAEVTVVTKSTMPFLKHPHRIAVRVDDGEEQIIEINRDLDWEHKYDLMYPTGASRVIVKSIRTKIGEGIAGNHRLRVRPLDPGVVFHKFVVAPAGHMDKSRLKPIESPYRRVAAERLAMEK